MFLYFKASVLLWQEVQFSCKDLLDYFTILRLYYIFCQNVFVSSYSPKYSTWGDIAQLTFLFKCTFEVNMHLSPSKFSWVVCLSRTSWFPLKYLFYYLLWPVSITWGVSAGMGLENVYVCGCVTDSCLTAIKRKPLSCLPHSHGHRADR